jgi:pentatricopeptide repeat-containing protein PET309
MLERASTCFETGGRQLLRAPKRCLRTRRMLHSAFWHHGASDLSLPIWWAATSILDGGSGDVDTRTERTTHPTPSTPHDGALFDFLYPAKTLALLKKLSAPGYDASKPRRRGLQHPPIRRFATAQWQPRHDESGVDPAVVLQAKEQVASLLKDSPAAQALAKCLEKREPGEQELAWQLYSALPAAHVQYDQDANPRADLLEYLTMDDEPNMPSRVLQLFGELPTESRRPSSYRAAIVAYISLRMVGPALQLLESAPQDTSFDLRHIGADVVLKRTIADEQWDLSLRVFKLFLDRTPTIGGDKTKILIRQGRPVPQVWGGVTKLPGLKDHLESFFTHVREFKHELRSSQEREEALSLFTTSFIPHVIDQVLRDHASDEPAMTQSVRRLFKTLRNLGLSTGSCYEHAIKGLLRLPQLHAVSDVPKLWVALYARYRQLCLETKDSTAPIVPSLYILRNMIVYHGNHDEIPGLEEVVEDIRTFYPHQPVRGGLLRYLIHMYADHGSVSQVHKYFDEFMTHYREKLDIHLLSALPFAYARRADVLGSIAQFNRIRDEFGLVPDNACWNILLLAYVRADDLDGALECFNSCIDSGLEPDIYSFGTLLDFCAQRGDVEAFEALFTRGKQRGVPLTQDVRARSGYVQAFLNAGDPEGAETIAQGMLRSWQAGILRGSSLTHTWNLLIQHHALDRDLVGARQRYKEMVDNDIPLDSWTYGSLMRALVAVKQSAAAYKILRETMPRNKLPVHALHYAIVMTGLLREGGGQLSLAVRAYEEMIGQGVAQTESSQEASIRTLGALELKDLKGKSQDRKLKLVEEAVQKMLAEAVHGQLAHRQPRHSRVLDSRNHGSTVQAYYGLLISLYADRGSYQRCKKLIEEADAAAPDVDNYTVPMTLITGTMEAHLKAGEHAKVYKCWKLARESASKLSKTFHQALQPEVPLPEFDSLIDPSVRERYEQSRISANRRHILYKAARLYIRSLLDPNNPYPTALQHAQRTIRDLLVNGYTLDTFTWNEFVVAIAQRGRLVDAFTTCETYLMPGFTGWRSLVPNYIRRDRTGYQWMELRHYEVKKTNLMPRYKTLIALAAEYTRVKSDERSGLGYDAQARAWPGEMLERVAPLTIRAIDSMPRTNDRLQVKHLRNRQ